MGRTKRWIALGGVGLFGVGLAAWHILSVVSLKDVAVPPVDLAKLVDGTYAGDVTYGLYNMRAEVVVSAWPLVM